MEHIFDIRNNTYQLKKLFKISSPIKFYLSITVLLIVWQILADSCCLKIPLTINYLKTVGTILQWTVSEWSKEKMLIPFYAIFFSSSPWSALMWQCSNRKEFSFSLRFTFQMNIQLFTFEMNIQFFSRKNACHCFVYVKTLCRQKVK